jgi:hypothetical protein
VLVVVQVVQERDVNVPAGRGVDVEDAVLGVGGLPAEVELLATLVEIHI